MDILPQLESQTGRRVVAGVTAATVMAACNVVLVRSTPQVSPQTAESVMEAVCRVPQYSRLDVCQPDPPSQVEMGQRRIVESLTSIVVQPMAYSVISWAMGPVAGRQ